MQARQFSRTHGLRRKLKEPNSAGQSSAASLCSQRTTSDDDSNRVSLMPTVCLTPHVPVNQKHVIRISMKTPWLSAILRFATETRLASEPPPSAPTPV